MCFDCCLKPKITQAPPSPKPEPKSQVVVEPPKPTANVVKISDFSSIKEFQMIVKQ